MVVSFSHPAKFTVLITILCKGMALCWELGKCLECLSVKVVPQITEAFHVFHIFSLRRNLKSHFSFFSLILNYTINIL